MNKSLLLASFALLTTSVSGMDSDYPGESSNYNNHNRSFRPIKRENPERNIQRRNNLLNSIRQMLNENANLKAIEQEKNREIQNLANELAAANANLTGQRRISKFETTTN